MENMTLYLTSASVDILAENTGLKDSVFSAQWGQHIEQTDSDSITSLKQCQALAILERWHYTVFDDSNNKCYFGILNTEQAITVDAPDEMQVSINTDELSQFVIDMFTTRESNVYYHYTYIQFVSPKNEAHCMIHCIFDTEQNCDFFFIVHSYCYLGYFNQESYAYHLTDTVTTYIYKGTQFYLKSILKVNFANMYDSR